MINDKTGTAMKFSSIAVPYTRGAILHYIRDKTYILKLSHKMRENWLKGRKLIYQGKSDQVIADTLEMDLTDWLETRVTCSGPPLELKEQGAPTIDIEADEADFSHTYLEHAAYLLDKLSSETQHKINLYFVSSNMKNIDHTIRNLLKTLQLDCSSLDKPSFMWYTDVV
jgi:RNA polymerase sigma-B factor